MSRFALCIALITAGLLGGAAQAQAVNTEVILEDGTLYVIGDSGPNRVRITIVPGGVFAMSESGNANYGGINGFSLSRVLYGTVEEVIVEGNSGNDEFNISVYATELAGDISVNLGAGSENSGIVFIDDECEFLGDILLEGSDGDDTLVARIGLPGNLNPIPGSVELRGLDGNDIIELWGPVDGDVVLDGGEGSNYFAFRDVTLDSEALVAGGDGSDVAVLSGFFMDGLELDLGAGSNEVTVEHEANWQDQTLVALPPVIAGGLNVNSAADGEFTAELLNLVADQVDISADAASIRISDSSIQSLTIETGAQWDEVNLTSVTCPDLEVRLGGGNDKLYLSGCTLGATNLQGNGGTADTIQTDGTNQYTTLSHSGFEFAYINEAQSKSTTTRTSTSRTFSTSTTTKDGTTTR